MKLSHIVLIVILSSVISITASSYLTSHHTETALAHESAYDRVMRTQTIRCGYAMWFPLLNKDANTGQLSGIFYDYVEALGKALKLKVEWAEEMGWGDFPAALETGRIDAFCTGAWPNATRARQIDFARAIMYQPIYAYVRADDKRFDNNLALLNDPSVTVATMDGEMSSLIAASDFSKAKTFQVPQLSNLSDLLLNVVTGKADVTFTDSLMGADYAAKNPGKIRRVENRTPLRIFGDPLPIAKGQDQLRRMLNTATDEMLSNGTIERIITKHEQYPGTLLRVAPPYQTEAP